jgi:hypothetical protein
LIPMKLEVSKVFLCDVHHDYLIIDSEPDQWILFYFLADKGTYLLWQWATSMTSSDKEPHTFAWHERGLILENKQWLKIITRCKNMFWFIFFLNGLVHYHTKNLILLAKCPCVATAYISILHDQTRRRLYFSHILRTCTLQGAYIDA